MSVIRLRAVIKTMDEEVIKEAFMSKIVSLGYVEPLLPDEVLKYYPLNEYDYRIDSSSIEFIVENIDDIISDKETGITINKVMVDQFNECLQLTSNERELAIICKRGDKWIMYYMDKKALMRYYTLTMTLEGASPGIRAKDTPSQVKDEYSVRLKVAYILSCDTPIDFIMNVYSSVYAIYFKEYRYELPTSRDLANYIIRTWPRYRNFIKLYTTDYYIYELTMAGYPVVMDNEGSRVNVSVGDEVVIMGNQIGNGDLYEITDLKLGALRNFGIGLDMIELYSCNTNELLEGAVNMLRKLIRA